MRFDTEEAFFKAVYTKAGFGPAQVGELAIEKFLDDRAKAVTTALVMLMRSAFDVHRSCNGQVDRNSTLLEYRLIGASRDLPEGWKVVVMAERDALRLDLYNSDDQRVEFTGIAGDELSSQVHDAVRAAIDSALEA